MKKALLTGAGGFIGSHLAELLVNNGFELTCFVHYNSANRWGWLENSSILKEVKVVSGDIRDFDIVAKLVKEADSVFHLAALIGIPYSYVSPSAYLKTNIEGTYNILQAALNTNCSNILITSTSETYGTARYVPIDEEHPLQAQSPYSATKIAADQLALSYHRSFGLPVKIVRPFNTYGPRQSARAVIPTIITQLLNNKLELDLGNLSPTRDLTYVEDTANGFIEIEKSGSLFGEVTNIGMNEEISIAELVGKISNIIDKHADIKSDSTRIRPEKSEVERLWCNNKKILEKTNWKPNFNLQTGLEKTIKWFSDFNNLKLYKPNIYNV